ncbi:MAG: hypothetical protein C5S49_01800 [Candidatus Methanogaster sp.]|nr:MAG: hypothetical protein C5S49_01800 [ANME-2 cluster archaeon]
MIVTSMTPSRKPAITGIEIKSAIHPIRSVPNTIRNTPTAIAIAVVSARYSAAPPAASAPTALAEIRHAAESGPTTSLRDVPKMAYRNSGIGIVYNPIIGGTPAIPA